MIRLSAVYILAGLVFAAFAVLSAGDRNNPKRFGNAAFWGLVALSFLAGDRLGDLGNGLLVVGLALIAGFGGLGRGQPATTSPEARRELAARFHGFYHDCRILGDDVPAATTQARLWLVEAARIGLAVGLDLLGVAAPESM